MVSSEFVIPNEDFMTLRLTTVHENARSALECGGSTPPYINLEREGQGGVKPPHSKVPSAQPFSWRRGISLSTCMTSKRSEQDSSLRSE
ncbi:MAG TPA: hypothetical protein VEO19_08005 [Terriglobia bacterium]|jgi:hypothetical protein|nr:hypothetical protein [Terriglobia bacterium]